MTNLIALGIAATSFLGLACIVAAKIPQLAKLSSREIKEDNVRSLVVLAREYALRTNIGKLFARPEYIMQKVLSAVRVTALRVEHAASISLEQIRKQAKDKQARFSQQYWPRLKKTSKKKEV